MSDQNILVTISGPDRPGITAQLMGIIVKSRYDLLDMGQSGIHGLLSLSILIGDREGGEREVSPILKDLLFAAKEMGVNLNFEIVQGSSLQTSLAQGDKFILSCVDQDTITAAFLRDLSRMLATFDVNILRIHNVNMGHHFKSLEITTVAPPTANLQEVKGQLLQIGQTHQTDIAFLQEHVYRRSKRLIVFDMDSTLIQIEVIDELAKAHGVASEVSQITAAAMNGELDFTESLTRRVAMLKGFPEEKLQGMLNALPLTPGAGKLISTVQELGYRVAIISGGFDPFARFLKRKLCLDYACANQLQVVGGKLTGKLLGTIIDSERKATLLQEIAQREKINLDQVVAIGDGANDLPMLAKAGLGIAFHAKEIVKRRADHHMSFGPMSTILYFLGIPEKEHHASGL